MEKKYAIKLKDGKFISNKWNHDLEEIRIYAEDLNSDNAKNILYGTLDGVEGVLNHLPYDIKRYSDMDLLEIENAKIVEVVIKTIYTVLED